jgi:hypothetical protein
LSALIGSFFILTVVLVVVAVVVVVAVFVVVVASAAAAAVFVVMVFVAVAVVDSLRILDCKRTGHWNSKNKIFLFPDYTPTQ